MRAIINFARGKWYPRGSARLARSLAKQQFYGQVVLASDEETIGAPRHEKAPYAFKPALFNHQAKAGAEIVLWCDSACFAIKPVYPIFDHIEKHGYLFFSNGIVGEWSSDAALESFGVSRDEAMFIVEMMGSVIGLNLRHDIAWEFLRRWTAKSLDGETFPGSWTNANHEVSSDPRVKGHRHDQTAASLVAWQLGMELTVAHESYYQYFESPSGKPWQEENHNDMSLIYPGVVLCNQGM